MVETSPALLPTLAAWADRAGAADALASGTGQPPVLLLVTSDAVTAEQVAAGASTVAPLADAAGADVRVTLTDPSVTGGLPADQVELYLELGHRTVDDAVDSGTPLLVVGGTGAAVTTASVTATVCRKEPVSVVRHTVGADPAVWRQEVTAVRDAMFRARGYRNGPWDAGSAREILRILGTPELAVTVGILHQAAARRTPVILDGADTFAAALLADAIAPGSTDWWMAAHVPPAPSAGPALDRLQLTPAIDRDLGPDRGGAGLTALALLRLAVRSSRTATPPPGA
ncbi:nicotinate-nucleotide- dimethylbenzimidazolephosphoribosyltransferase [Corynebacterium terpenotabidum Y-11]|uniref:Nicotinate-nucleotide-dimethylbenzimidazolephosphoribosyltransferase n=1 Tax=Corynebacterium terpenotabidum Y-11 TaxID=1200352 RepID=S4XFW9_9CORY|nr:nicotinate-nucleotide- dimethylbenzimidazolephosphoribosyltransferase [Corynebacterium terpenotabidum Y-11]